MASRNAVLDELETLGWWYQSFQLPDGTWTGDGAEPAYFPHLRWECIEPFVPADLSGCTVLDLGGNSGYFSIRMKLRGAARCVLVDAYDQFLRQADFAARQFGVEIEMVNDDAHTYCLTHAERFDYVLLLGLLYHLKYPGIVLDRAAEMTRRRLYLASAVIGPEDADVPPQLTFVEELYRGDPTNWWLPNFSALPAMMRSAGLRVIGRPHPHVLIAEPERYLGKTAIGNLVFPKYGKRDGAVHPGPQQVDAQLWSGLCARAAAFRREQRAKTLD
jgi:tRNA (mo5U34)-methyltransferase